jgi:hypothetical protein
MRLPETGQPDIAGRTATANGKIVFPVRSGAAILLGALLMVWPALFNRYPLLYPDSITYLGDGRLVARAVFLHRLSEYYGMRSFFYSLGILPWHWNVTAWPIVVLQSLLTAYVIWLVVRSILPRQTVSYYLILVALLSLLTSLDWFVSLIMPDILGPLLYLCIYLLVFARDTLSRTGRMTLIPIAWWGIVSHASHLILAAGLCILLASLLLLRLQWMRGRWRAVGEVAMIVLFAAVSQLALHAYLYGTPSLNGERPPFLMARVLADGPGLWYLQQHCPNVQFVLCDHLQELPQDPDVFLWGEKGIWGNADDATTSRLRQEEMPFVEATLRAYPWAQLSRSLSNFGQQLRIFGFYLFGPSDWMAEEFASVLPGERSQYLQSRQAQDELPLEFFTSVQNWTVLASLAIIVAFLPRMFRRGPPRLIGLGIVIGSTVVANALVTGALSMVEDRLQSRVIWLVPLLAIVLVLDWCEQLQKSRGLVLSKVHSPNPDSPTEHTSQLRSARVYPRQTCVLPARASAS